TINNGAAGTFSVGSHQIHVYANAGNDSFTVSGSVVTTVDGGSGASTLLGNATSDTFNITGVNAGSLNNTLTFANVKNLTGGAAADTFALANGAFVSGTVTGGGGGDNLELSAYSTFVSWNVAGNAGSMNSAMAFTGIPNLKGGSGGNVFRLGT